MGDKRRAMIVLESSLTEHGYIPSVVTEGEPGHSPMTGQGEHAQPWYWGHDLAAARRIAADYNRRLGLTEEDAREIEASSHRAQNDSDWLTDPLD